MSHCVGQLPTLQFQFIHTVFGEDNQNELPPQLRQIHQKENTYFFFLKRVYHVTLWNEKMADPSEHASN